MTIITDATALAWFDQFRVIDGDRLCPEMTLIFADWLEDVHGLDSWAECLRWMVAEGKVPIRGSQGIIHHWWAEENKWPKTSKPDNFLSSAIMNKVGRFRYKKTLSIMFDSPQAAILAVMKVWHLRDDKP